MIRVEKVLSKRELKEFIAFPSQLFRDDPNWIEPLHVEREEHLSKKNPGTDHIEWQAWVDQKTGQSRWAHHGANRCSAPGVAWRGYRPFRHD